MSMNNPPPCPNDIALKNQIFKLSYAGTVSRVSFLHYLIFFIANILIWTSLYLDAKAENRIIKIDNYFLLVYALVIFYFLIVLISSMVRRYHDAGISSRVIFIPFKNITALFKPTKYLDNPYAPQLQKYYEQYLAKPDQTKD